jgi:hypothetical protein
MSTSTSSAGTKSSCLILDAAGRAGAALLVFVLVALSAGAARAHPLSPALLEIQELGDGRVEVAFKTPRLQAPGVALHPVLPAGCESLREPEVTQDAAAILARWTLRCATRDLVGGRVGVDGLSSAWSVALVRIRFADGRVVKRALRAGEPSFLVPERDRPLDVMRAYALLGLEHILTGPDHLLFVFGLLLLVVGPRLLVKTITAFTVGHSITLTLATLGLVRLPSQPMEVLIALSIYVLAVELARGGGTSSTRLGRSPWIMALAFGLLHGLGFAGALREVGLPSGEIPLALLSFNLGIELGQLVFVAAILAAGGLLRAVLPPLPAWTRWLPLYGMGSLSVMWCVERTLTWLG